MRVRVAAFCAGLLAGGFPLAAPAQPSPAATRTLVYAFETRTGPAATGHPDNAVAPAGEIRPDDCLSGGMKVAAKMSSSIALGNGGIDWFQTDCTSGFGYKINAVVRPDRGSISIGTIGKQSDDGLVVQMTETMGQAQPSSITCAVYPTTALVCDPSKTVSPEEVSLLRFLAPGIVDARRDGKNWQLQESGPQSSFTATFELLKNAAGVMTIGEQRSAKGEAGPYSTDESRSTFLYDVAQAVPTAIDESLVQKTVRFGKYLTMERQTIFRLQTP